MTETEYLKQLVEINGRILAELGKIVIKHVPNTTDDMDSLGDTWLRAIDSLETEYHSAPIDDQRRIIVP